MLKSSPSGDRRGYFKKIIPFRGQEGLLQKKSSSSGDRRSHFKKIIPFRGQEGLLPSKKLVPNGL
jgi:hypothetical protein